MHSLFFKMDFNSIIGRHALIVRFINELICHASQKKKQYHDLHKNFIYI